MSIPKCVAIGHVLLTNLYSQPYYYLLTGIASLVGWHALLTNLYSQPYYYLLTGIAALLLLTQISLSRPYE
jgi:hypothetical protein